MTSATSVWKEGGGGGQTVISNLDSNIAV
jgi:hypothetical protein